MGRYSQSCSSEHTGRAKEGKGRKKEKEAPTGGTWVSATHKKKKKRRVGGPLGCWAERER
jgi:hypothetical protein